MQLSSCFSEFCILCSSKEISILKENNIYIHTEIVCRAELLISFTSRFGTGDLTLVHGTY